MFLSNVAADVLALWEKSFIENTKAISCTEQVLQDKTTCTNSFQTQDSELTALNLTGCWLISFVRKEVLHESV